MCKRIFVNNLPSCLVHIRCPRLIRYSMMRLLPLLIHRCFFLSYLLAFKSVRAFVGVCTLSDVRSGAAVLSTYGNNSRRQIHCTAAAVPVDAITDEDTTLAPNGLFKRDCYIATNRFAVRPNQQAIFEKRWATRKSRLAVLPGFRYFHLMRRVNPVDGSYDGGDDSNEAAQENYVSFTIWNKKSDFSAWRKGDAFKEAHGGTSIISFVSTMVNSALVLRGAPKPAFYDGLFLNYQKPTYLPDPVDGWRNVVADGVNTLPEECFIQMVKYFVPPDQTLSFEMMWKERETLQNNDKCDGFVVSSLMRRDGQAKGHGMTPMDSSEPNYVAMTIFASQQQFDSSNKKLGATFVDAAFIKQPKTVFYQGTLMLSSP